MKIMKFKLLNGGLDGIELEAKEYLASGKFQIVDDVKRTRRIMLSDELIDEVKKLKYFFLNLTGHWIPPFNSYYDAEAKKILPIGDEPSKAHLLLKDLWNKVTVTGAKANGEGFLLTGKIEAVEGKQMGLSTVFVTSDDDIGFFTEAMQVLDDVAVGISEYIRTQAIPIEEAKQKVPKKLIEGKTDEEIGQIAAEYMMKNGAIIMMNGNNEPDQLPEKTGEDATVHESTKSIDSKNQPEAKEDVSESKDDQRGKVGDNDGSEGNGGVQQSDEAENQSDAKSAKKEPFGQAAASLPADVSGEIAQPAKKSDDGPKGQDLTSMEHSENMGIETEGKDMDPKEEGEEDDW